MISNPLRTNLTAALAALALTLGAGAARAEVYIPTKEADTNDGACNADCSLREAVIAANARPGADVILLKPGDYLLTLTGAGEDAAAFGDLDLLDDVTIVADGAEATRISGLNQDRVLQVFGGVTADVRGVSLESGAVTGPGGVALNAGTLLLNRVSVNSGTSSGPGGGIATTGTLRLAESIVLNSHSNTAGGGIHASGTVEIVNSTITKNDASLFGGGLYFVANTDARINNATIAFNASPGQGGGVFAESSAFIGQHAPRFTNSILAKNTSNAAPSDCSGAPLSGGYNFVGLAAGCSDFSLAKSDIIGTSGAGIDPRLGELANNGGETLTYALPEGGSSLAQNGGNPATTGADACEGTDQRGAARPGFGRCDIGAFEVVQVCVPGGNTLCLNEGRFMVKATWTSATGTGEALAKALTPETGYFYFFDPANVEITVKVLNGCGFNNRYWVFLGGMTNVAATVTVYDFKTGNRKVYTNPLNTVFRTQLDTNAFATCP